MPNLRSYLNSASNSKITKTLRSSEQINRGEVDLRGLREPYLVPTASKLAGRPELVGKPVEIANHSSRFSGTDLRISLIPFLLRT